MFNQPIIKVLIITLLCFLLDACMPFKVVTPTTKVETIQSLVKEPPVLKTEDYTSVTPTHAAIPLPSPSRRPTDRTENHPPEQLFQFIMLRSILNLESETLPSGALVLTGEQSFLINFNKGMEREEVPDYDCLSTTPDGKWLSYCPFSPDSPTGQWLIIESADRKMQKKVAIDNNLIPPLSHIWIDDQKMLLTLLDDSYEVRPLVSINPFTDEKEIIMSNYPGIEPSMWMPMHFKISSVSYDPSLNLVVYPLMEEGHRYIVLWDRKNEKALGRVEDLGIYGFFPLWSPDGERFAVVVSYMVSDKPDGKNYFQELISLNREGQVERLTFFADYRNYFGYVNLGQSQWSPDGSRLAFWVDMNKGPCSGIGLGILSIDTKKVAVYCLPNSINTDAIAPIWSLDGRFIAVENYPVANTRQAMLINLEQGWVLKIADDVFPVGWLATQ